MLFNVQHPNCGSLCFDTYVFASQHLYKKDKTLLLLLPTQDTRVTKEFELLEKNIKENKPEVVIVHGGVMNTLIQNTMVIKEDFVMAFNRDPMTTLRRYLEKSGLRMIDFFKQLDRDCNMTLSKDDFIKGVKVDLDVKLNSNPLFFLSFNTTFVSTIYQPRQYNASYNTAFMVDWSLSVIMTSKLFIRESESEPAASSILISRMTSSLSSFSTHSPNIELRLPFVVRVFVKSGPSPQHP